MADRFPIIVDTSGIAALKELPAGDNLNLLNSGVVNAGAVDLTTITVSGSQGSDGQVLTSTGSGVGWENASAGGISDIVSDTSPQLGGTLDANSNNIDMGTNVLTDANLGNFITAHAWGNHGSAGYITSTLADTSPQLGGALDVNGQDIVSTSNGAIDLDPHGSGVVVFKGNATKGAGQFKLNCESNTHGVIIKGPAHAAAANYTLTLPTSDGNADQQLKTDGSGNLAWVDAAAGGGGAWNVMSSQTVTSDVASVVFTNVTGYKTYKLVYTDVLNDSTGTAYQLSLSSNNGTSYASIGVKSTSYEQNSTTSSGTITNQFYQSNRLPINKGFNQFNNNEQHHGEVTIYGLNDSSGHTYIHGQMLSSWGWNTNNVAGNEVYARSYGSGSLVAFNAFKITAMADSDHKAGTWTLYGLSIS